LEDSAEALGVVPWRYLNVVVWGYFGLFYPYNGKQDNYYLRGGGALVAKE